MAKYRVVKQFVTGSNAYVAKLQESDSIYEYDKEQDAFDRNLKKTFQKNTFWDFEVIFIKVIK